MIRITQCSIPCGAGQEALADRLRNMLKMTKGEWERCSFRIVRHSVDARRKPQLLDVYSAEVMTPLGAAGERKLVKKLRSRNISTAEPVRYRFPSSGSEPLRHRPVVIGAGPAGLFCALFLAEHGYRPLVLERGAAMEERIADVRRFWETGELNPDSNVQFGEGGAGTFSDGKLNTQVNDRTGRIAKVLETFVEAGAPQDILYENLPHIGTDKLRKVVPALRERIIRAGGEVRFGARVSGFDIENGALKSVIVNGSEKIEAQAVILAPGHSARDTVRTLFALGVPMEQKNFAVGMRVSHSQSMIDRSQYGIADGNERRALGLSPAPYKLTAKAASGRGVYTFCMCPGGYVVNASSEPGRLAVNGMSDYDRGSGRANSAVVMTVGREEFGDGVLDGLLFQERLEERAYRLGNGKIPAQPYPDFRAGAAGSDLLADPCGAVSAEELCVRGDVVSAPMHTLLPASLTQDFIEGMEAFGRRIEGFASEDAWVLGMESRTSSPVRILRDDAMRSPVDGLYPCGEGAGYAGGITSAAADGIRVAEAVAARFAPL